jgi:tetratricopeptide (TPR) repeat protein
MRKALELLPPGVDPPTEARLNRGLVSGSRNLPASVMRAAGERAVEIYRGLADRTELAEALRGLAQLIGWYFRDERELADALACESIEIARGLDDPVQLALSLRTRGLTIDISDIPQKRAVLEESLALLRRHGNDRQMASMLTWISDFEFSAGDWPQALAYGREAVSYAESSGSNQIYATAMCNLSTYAGAIGEWETARNAIAASIASCRKTRQQEYISFSVQAASAVAAGNGRPEDAARLIGWCDVRVDVLHAGRQADQSEEITHRKLTADLRERLGTDELARLMSEGAMMNEDEAFALALTA